MPKGGLGGSGNIRKALREELSSSVLKNEIEFTDTEGATALIQYNNYLYVGLTNVVQPYAKIMRFDGENWLVAYDLGKRAALWGHAVFDGKLYFGGMDVDSVTGLIIEFDGTTWTERAVGTKELYSLAVYGANLYAGTMSIGEVWSSPDGVAWALIYTSPVAGRGLSALVHYGANLYAAHTSNLPGVPYGGETPHAWWGNIYSYNGVGWAISKATIQELIVQDSVAVARHFYAGERTYRDFLYYGGDCGSLWRFDGTTWVKVARLDGPINRMMAIGTLLVMVCGEYYEYDTTTDQCRLNGGPPNIGRRSNGSIWITDGVLFRKVCDFPDGIGYSVEKYKGKLYVSSGLGAPHDYPRLYSLDISMMPELLRAAPLPQTLYFEEEDETLWKAAVIAANDTTLPIPCLGFHEKTLSFLSTANGTLTIYIDPVGDNDWQTLKTSAITANIPYMDLIEYDYAFIKLKFSAIATVTAKLVLS